MKKETAWELSGQKRNRIKKFRRKAFKNCEASKVRMRHGLDYREHYGGYVKRSKIIGLLNKFVNKPWNDFYSAFLNRTSKESNNATWMRSTPDYYVWREDTTQRRYRNNDKDDYRFYVDEDGILRRNENKLPRWRYQTGVKFLTKRQYQHNKKVKFPWGQVVEEPRRYFAGPTYLPGFNTPQFIGKVFVIYKQKAYLLPLYHCPGKKFEALAAAQSSNKDVVQYMQTYNFGMPISKIEDLNERWMKVHIVPGVSRYHYHTVEVPNPDYKYYLTSRAQALRDGNPERAAYYARMLSFTRQTRFVNLGYGELNFFVLRHDFETIKALESLSASFK